MLHHDLSSVMHKLGIRDALVTKHEIRNIQTFAIMTFFLRRSRYANDESECSFMHKSVYYFWVETKLTLFVKVCGR